MNALKSFQLGPLSISLVRTCRVPRREGYTNELPAGLGTFPVYRVADYASKVPENWRKDGHFIPMYPQEAMWISFGRASTPVALLVGAGMVNAVTGKKLEPVLSQSPQNYLVIPPQLWLDGFKRSEDQSVFQFVAAELGKGETVEEQISGKAEFGGIQLGLHTPKVPLVHATRPHEYVVGGEFLEKSVAVRRFTLASAGPRDMGLGLGGAIKQKIYPDPYLDGREVQAVWSDEPSEKAYIHIVHSNDFKAITGMEAPPSPITYQVYQANGLPWFGLPDGSWGDVEGGGEVIEDLKPVSGGPDLVNTGDQSNPISKDLW